MAGTRVRARIILRPKFRAHMMDRGSVSVTVRGSASVRLRAIFSERSRFYCWDVE